MSRGIGAHSKIKMEDENEVVYRYSVYNYNEKDYRDAGNICDGSIIIKKSELLMDLDIVKLLDRGDIVINNCSHCFGKSKEGYDSMALHILFKIFNKYKKNGFFDNEVGYDV